MSKNRRKAISRDDLLREATSLHDQLLGKDHCDRSRIHSCVALQQCIPQAAENLRKKQINK